ncbi:putative membrane protein, partial [Chlamydia psittaci 10_743_SC13]
MECSMVTCLNCFVFLVWLFFPYCFSVVRLLLCFPL